MFENNLRIGVLAFSVGLALSCKDAPDRKFTSTATNVRMALFVKINEWAIRGRGITPEAFVAKVAGCRAGDEVSACMEAGEVADVLMGVVNDISGPRLAKEMYQMGCELGDELACEASEMSALMRETRRARSSITTTREPGEYDPDAE